MGFASWVGHAGLSAGRALRGNVNALGTSAKRFGGAVWANRDNILEGIIAAGTIAGSIAIIGTGPLGTIAGVGGLVAGTQSLKRAISSISGGPADPVFRKKDRAKKRRRDAVDSKNDTAPGVGGNQTQGEPRISGDQRSRMANMASMR